MNVVITGFSTTPRLAVFGLKMVERDWAGKEKTLE
jgi:hypothetical protein